MQTESLATFHLQRTMVQPSQRTTALQESLHNPFFALLNFHC